MAYRFRWSWEEVQGLPEDIYRRAELVLRAIDTVAAKQRSEGGNR